MTTEEIQKRFEDKRPPRDGSVADVRRLSLHQAFEGLAILVESCTHDGREKALALTKLEEGLGWALKGGPKT